MHTNTSKVSRSKQLLSLTITSLFVLQPVLAADIVVDKPHSGNTFTDTSRNGVPVVNIATPDSNGVSHNAYHHFNVPTQGAILNNADRDVETQTAGWISGNRNVRDHQADLILNEVTGTSRTYMRGNLEVAGKRADVIVANPNGITVNGGGFINIPKATLTTGKVSFKGGRPVYDVQRGDIYIDGKGLNAKGSRELQIYTKAIKFNAKLHANDLDIVTGINHIDADGKITSKDSSGKSRPAFSIDSTAMGGIYANKIRLVGTQKGVGVNLPPVILAQDSLQISADGRIIIGKARARRHMRIRSHRGSVRVKKGLYAYAIDLDALTEATFEGNTGAQTALNLNVGSLKNYGLLAGGVDEAFSQLNAGKLVVRSQTSVENSGVMFGSDTLEILAASLVNKTDALIVSNAIEVAAASSLDNRGTIKAGQMEVTTKEMTNSGTLYSTDTMTLRSNNFDNSHGTLVGDGAVTLHVTDTLTNTDGTLYAGDAMHIQVKNLKSDQGNIIAKATLTLAADGNVTMDQGYIEGRGVDLRAGMITSTASQILSYADLVIHVAGMEGSHTSIQSSGSLTLKATGDVRLDQESLLYGKKTITLNARHFANRDGSIVQAEGDARIDTDSVDNTRGIIASRTLQITSGHVDNIQGVVQATDNVDLDIASLDNTQGTLQTDGSIHVTASGNINNTEGTIYSQEGTTIQAHELTNEKGFIGSLKTVFLDLFGLDGDDGTVSGDGVTIRTTTIASDNTTIQSSGALDITAGGDVTLTNASVLSNGELNVTAQDTNLNGATVYAGHDSVHVVSRALQAQNAYIEAKQTLTVSTSHGVDISNSTIKGEDIAVSTAKDVVANSTNVVASGNLDITADNLTHGNGQLVANQNLNLTLNGTLSQDHSTMIAHQNAAVTARNHTMSGASTLYGADDLRESIVQTLDLSDNSRLISQGDVTLDAQTVVLDHSLVSAGDHLQIDTDQFTNTYGTVSAASARLNTRTFDNHDSNFTAAGGALTLHVAEQLNNRSGLISSQSDMTIHAGELDTREGEIEAGNTLAVTSHDTQIADSRFFAGDHLALVSNISTIDAGSKLLSGGSMDLRFDGGMTNKGEITSNNARGGQTHLTVHGDLNNHAKISASGSLVIDAHSLNNNLHNTHASIKGAGDTVVTLNGNLNNAGFLTSRDNLNIKAGTITNSGGIAARVDVTLEADNLTNSQTIYSGSDTRLYVRQKLHNNPDAVIYSGGDMTIAADEQGGKTSQIINTRARIESQGDMTLQAATLKNTGKTTIQYTTHYRNTITGEIVTRAQMEAWENARKGKHWFDEVENVQSESGVKGWLKDKDLYDNVVDHYGELPHTGDDSLFGDDTVSYAVSPWVEFRSEVADASTTDPAVISSGRDMTLKVNNVTNKDATISAARDIIADVGTLNNTPTTRTVNTERVTDTVSFGFDDGLGDNDTWVNVAYTTSSDGTTRVGGTSQIVAGGAIRGTIDRLQNGVTEHGNVHGPQWSDPEPDTATQATQDQAGAVAGVDSAVHTDVVADQTHEVTLPSSGTPEDLPLLPEPVVYDPAHTQIKLPDNPYDLYITNPDPNEPLITTNPEYTGYDNFVSSDYMLEHLGYDGTDQIRRLGDAMYETQLIRDAIISLTGQRFIGGARSDTEMYQHLMDNGITYADEVGLKIGVAPTREQLKKLKKDLVWMVAKKVGGKTVLVPVVYLAHKYTRPKGAAIHAGSIDLTVKGHLGNSGSIRTREDMKLRAGSVTNDRGDIEAGANMDIRSMGDIKNLSGKIKGGSVVLKSRKGNIVNKTLSHGVDVSTKMGKEHYTVIDKTASIESTKGSLKLDAAKNIDTIGADLSSKGAMSLKAGKNVNIKTIQDKHAYEYKFADGEAKGKSVKHTQSHIKSGGLLDIDAGKDANLEAANIDAKHTRIKAKNKVNLTAVVDHEEHSSHFEHSSFLSENTQRDAVQKETAKGTTIQTGALVIEGKKGVTMESATVEADAASITSAHGDVTLTAKAVTNGSHHEKSSSTIGGLFKSRSVDAESKTTLADSTTHAKNQITIGGKNVTLTATSLKTDNGAIALRAEDKVTIQAGMESETKTKIREKSGLFQGGHLWQSKSDSTQTHDEHAKASVIEAGAKGATDEEVRQGAGSVIITAGSADVIGSQIKADNHIIAHTDVGSITVKEAKEQHTRSEVHEEKNLDLTLGVKTGGGGVAVTIAKAEYDKKALTEASTSSAASSLEAGGSVQLTSVEDITIQGSDVAAGGDVALDAQGDVTIREAKDTMDQTTDHTHAEAEVSIGVKNQVAAAAVAAKEVVDATKALKRSKRALDKYKKTLAQYKKDYEAGIISQEDYEEAQSDLKYYQLNVAMAIKNEASAVKNAASAAKGIATSGATGGFTGEVRLDLKGSKTHATAEATSSRASTIVAGHSVQIVTGKTLADGTRDTAGSHTTISGSHIAAGDTIDVSTGRLDITASRDTTRSDASTTSLHASVTAGTAGISGASAGGGISKDHTRTTTHTNSTLTADKLTLHSSGDTNIKGANLHAKSLTSLDVGGNLRVESVQDYESTRSVGVDASVGFSTDRDAKGHKTGTTSTASANYHSKNGTWRSVTNQTSITSEGEVAINTKGNTHLKGALIEGKKATAITTATLTSEDITNRADYRGIDVGVSYTHSTTKGKENSNGLKPNVGMPQKKNKSATTHTAIADNTQITITDKKHQKQDTSKISTDTEHASYTMTKINTEVLDIRKSVSKDIAKEGFKAVGDLAMKQAAKGDKAWEDGGAKKIIAHAIVGGVAAAVGNGDAISGAAGAAAAEAARPATKNSSEATQQWVSTLVGGAAGGGLTGASTALDGEKYNRQLHQKEIAWIKKNAAAFARANGMSQKDAQMLLTISALGMVDAQNSATLQQMIRNGTISQSAVQSAQNYIKGHAVGETFHDEHHYDDSFGHDQGLFTVNREQFFDHSYDPNTMKEGAVPVSPLDYLPVGRGAGAAFRGIGKKGVRNSTSIVIDENYIPYAPARSLPRTKHGAHKPESDYPHTQIGIRTGRKGEYVQAKEWSEKGNRGYDDNTPNKLIEFTDHGRPSNHTNPHEHNYDPSSGKKGNPEPFSPFGDIE